MFWCLVHFSTGVLSWGLYANPLEVGIQFAVACSEAKDGGLLVPWQLMECVLIWVVSSNLAVEDGFLFITDRSFGFSVGQMWRGLLLFPFFCELVCYFIPLMPVCAGIQWRTPQVVWAKVLMFSVSFFFTLYQVHQTWGLAGLRVSLWGRLLSWAFLPTKWWFLWHSAVLGLQLYSLSTVSHWVLTQRMEVCLDAWCTHHILHFLWRFQLSHRCRYNNNNERISRVLFHVKHAQLRWTGANTKTENACI